MGTDRSANETDGKALVRMLVERGADPNQQMYFRPPREPGMVSSSSRGTTPFHRACASLDVDLIKYLLAHGAEINLHTAHGETAMMVALGRGREDDVLATLRALHEAGADVSTVAQIQYINRNRGGSVLHMATRRGLKKVMAEFVAWGAGSERQRPGRPHLARLRDVARMAAVSHHASRAARGSRENAAGSRRHGGTREDAGLAERVRAHRTAATARSGYLPAVSTRREFVMGRTRRVRIARCRGRARCSDRRPHRSPPT